MKERKAISVSKKILALIFQPPLALAPPGRPALTLIISMFDNLHPLHFIGIGGSGISALAYLALAQNKRVSGSDVGENPTTQELQQDGVKLFKGHQKEHLPPKTELVIYTEAIDRANNPEYLEAQRRGLPCLSYFEALGALSKEKKTIAVAGTHGKTTTTAMLGQALIAAGLDPTVIVGTRVPAFGGKNIHLGQGDFFVVEACEYRRSFLHLQPFGVVLLNCELEHVDYYKNEDDYVSAFQALIQKLPEEGFLVYNQEDENCRKIAQGCLVKTIGVHWEEAEGMALKVPGTFNQLNAAHALKAAEQMGGATELILDSLSRFGGTSRRMQIKGEAQKILVMDDYGHHPTEVKATLKALKTTYPQKRLICVFQPHQYSRTRELLDRFKTAFVDADVLVIPNIYEARDTPADKAGMNVEKLVQAIAQHHPHVRDGKGLEATTQWLVENAQAGDLVLTLGAGDVDIVGTRFIASWQENT